MSYSLRLLKGVCFSLGLSLLIAYLMVSFTSRFEFTSGDEALFYIFVNAPSEELMFRFAVPLVIMYILKTGYLMAGIVSSFLFGIAHYWAYHANTMMIVTAIMGGVVYTLTVYLFSNRDPFNFEPGLLAAMIGHALYNTVITYVPNEVFYISMICLGILVILHVGYRGNLND